MVAEQPLEEVHIMENKTDPCLSCVDCHVFNCHYQNSKYPDFCPTTNMPRETYQRAMDALRGEEDNRIAVAAACVEYEGYGRQTRVEEVIRFAKRIGAKKIGIATCLGLIEESRILTKILRINGFEVVGAVCKAGATPKVEIGIPQECDAVGAMMCNPVLQAELLNDAGTDLNLIMGLCVGHDMLFTKYSEAPVTTLVAKDRVLAHNPVGAIYQAKAYYRKKLEP